MLPDMYRYGDGTPFPLDENFIETLTTAVETCTNAFVPLTELDARREKAREVRREADKELGRLSDLEATVIGSLLAFAPSDSKKPSLTQQVSQKITAGVKSAVSEARRQIEGRVAATEPARRAQDRRRRRAQGAAAVLRGAAAAQRELDHVVGRPRRRAVGQRGGDRRPDLGQLQPGARPLSRADPGRAAAGRRDRPHDEEAACSARPSRRRSTSASTSWSRSRRTAARRSSRSRRTPTSRPRACGSRSPTSGATWVSITAAGDADGDPNPLDPEDVAPVRQLAEKAYGALRDLTTRRTLVDLSLGNTPLPELEEPRIIPLELLAQLTPLARTIREKSRMSGELILKRDIGDGRREELFVPRATLAAQFVRLPHEYRRPFEDMGITNEETSPAIQLPPRPPAPPRAGVNANTIKIDND